MILMYDLDDNYICEFKDYKECAKYFKTTVKVICCWFSRNKYNKVKKKRDFNNNRWVMLFKDES